MASMSKTRQGSYKLRWLSANGQKKAIGIGKITSKAAKQFQSKFEELVELQRVGASPPALLVEWANRLAPSIKQRLCSEGLLAENASMSLGTLCEEFRRLRCGVAEATRTRDEQVCKLLIDYFGSTKMIEAITPKDAADWRQHIAEHGNRRDGDRSALAENTVRRRTGVASQIFKAGVRWGAIGSDPFAGLPTSILENHDRDTYVPWTTIRKVIDVAPNAQWKALIAFVRLTGCRAPSELRLSWKDVDFESGTIRLHSPKTAHHGAEHATRVVPLFQELRPYLEAWAGESRESQEGLVFPIAKGANLGTQLARFIRRAGLEPWPKLMVNLRASRETELIDQFPATEVCRWLGHSTTVAAKYYSRSRSEITIEAAKVPSTGCNAGVPGGVHQGPPEAIQQPASVQPEANKTKELAANEGKRRGVKLGDSGRCKTRTCDPLLVRQVL